MIEVLFELMLRMFFMSVYVFLGFFHTNISAVHTFSAFSVGHLDVDEVCFTPFKFSKSS